MINLQKLINELKDEKSNANEKEADCIANDDMIRAAVYVGKGEAFDFLIRKLKLLLNTERRKNGEKCDKK